MSARRIAPWQVELAVVPRRALLAAADAPRAHPIDADWWSGGDLPRDYARQLATIAAPASGSAAPPTSDVQSWGQEDGNRIDVWMTAGKATRITASVDVRRLDSKFGAMLLQFARVADAVLIRGDGLVIEPLVGAFAAALRGSDAWRFANDPGAKLASYASDEDDDDE